MEEKSVSIVLGSYNRKHFLKATIKSVRDEIARTSFGCEIIVVDGGSNDGSLQWLAKQKDIVTIIQHNRGIWQKKQITRRSWGYFMNLGFKIAQGKYVCMISDDCLMLPRSLEEGFKFFEIASKKEKVGAVAFYFREWPISPEYHINVNFGRPYVNHGMYLNEALKEVGYIDEENYMFYGADIDLVLKMNEKGYQCLACPTALIEHFSHANNLVRKSNSVLADKDAATLQKKWQKLGNIGGEWKTIKHTGNSHLANQIFRPLLVKDVSRQFIQAPVLTSQSILKAVKRKVSK